MGEGVTFAPAVCWRVSKRGLVIGGVDGDALLLVHPRAAELPDLIADAPCEALLAQRLGAPNADTLVAEMLEIGILTPTDPAPASPAIPTPAVAAGAVPAPGGAAPGNRDPRAVVDPEHPDTKHPDTEHLDTRGPDVGAAAPAADQPSTAQQGPDGRWAPRADPPRGVVFTRSGAEFPGIERPARWLDRRVVPLVLSWPGQVLLAAVVAAGVAALIMGQPDGPTVSAYPAVDALLGLAVMLVLAAAHELAHAVALVHYGRRPRRAGFGFYWGGISFYVDSTEALTLLRRQRVTQALVGLGVDVVTVSLLAITAQLSSTVLIVAVAWRLAVVGVADLVVNLLPILEVDGHWALADYLDEPELAPRARAALGAVLRRTPSRARGAGQRGLAAYGALSVLGGLGLLAGSALIWWTVAADLIGALFTGNPAEIAIGVVLVGPVALSLLASAAGLLLETVLSEPDSPGPAAFGGPAAGPPTHHTAADQAAPAASAGDTQACSSPRR